MSKVLVFFAEGFEEIEGLTAVDLLRRAGVDTDMVSVTDDLYVTGSHKIRISCDKTLKETDFEGADFLVLPGGMPGTKNLEGCQELMGKLDIFNEKAHKGEDKHICAICAAPSIFAHRGYLKGKKACSHPSVEEQLKEGGADVLSQSVTVDGHIVTSRGMGTAMDFGLKLVELIKGADTAADIGKSIVYRV